MKHCNYFKCLVILVATLLPQGVMAYDFKVGNFCYNLNDDGVSVTLTKDGIQAAGSIGYPSLSGAITIPASVAYNGRTYSVTKIDSDAFFLNTTLTSVSIPNSVISIGHTAFDGCTGLSNISLSNSLQSIGMGAFTNCRGLTNIVIPNSVTVIEDQAFDGCTGLTTVTIPSSVMEIGGVVFDDCINLKEVIWNARNCIFNPQYMGEYSSLQSEYSSHHPTIETIILGSEVESIPASMCKKLTSLKNFSFGTSSVETIGGDTFYGCTGLTSVTIPNSVETIGGGAFYGCTGLTSVAIPNSVTSIIDGGIFNKPRGVFEDCTGLMSVVIDNSAVSIGKSAFKGCTGLSSVSLGNAAVSIGASAFAGCTGLSSIEIPNSVATLDSEAFKGCTSLESISIPNSVTTISSEAFYGCTSLESISIPNSVTTISSGAFYGCTSLESISIPNSVTTISSVAFNGCTSLESISIPNSVTTIGGMAFNGCTSLGSVTWNAKDCADFTTSPFGSSVETMIFGNGVERVPSNLCAGLSGLENLTLSNSIINIGGGAFKNCTSLRTVSIPNFVRNVGENAFSGCNSLTHLSIGKFVTTIGDSAFLNCGNLEEIVVVSGNTKYDSRGNCNALIETANNMLLLGCKNTLIPNSVTDLGHYSFFNCDGLVSIIIPSSITTIGNWAFSGCTGLVDIFSEIEDPADVTLGGNVFSNVPTTTNLHVPEGSETLYETADQWNALRIVRPAPMPVVATSIILSSSESALVEGETLQLTATVLPEDTSNKTVVWSSTNDAVASVDTQGLVTANSEGVATIIATTTDGSNLSATCSIVVEGTVLAESLSVEPSLVELAVGETLPLTATVLPENASKNLTWSTSNGSVATVDDNGLLTAVSVGEAIIIATTTDGSRLSATCHVIVNESILAESLAVTPSEAALAVGETVTLVATVLPEDATDKSVVWSTSNEEVATVEAGVVTAVAAGTATITATTADGSDLSATCEVTVTGTDQPVLADNRIEVADCSAHSGDSFVLDLNMVNTDDAITAFQVDMYLPEGLTLALDEYDDPLVDLEATRLRNRDDHTVMVAEQPDGAIRIMSYSPTTKPFIGNEGALVHVTLKVQEELEDCELSVVFRDVTLTNVDEQEYITDALTCHVSVSRYQRGDVNGDDKVNVTDIVALANRVMGNPSQNFIERMADVSGDGKVNVTDIVALSKLVMGEGTSNGAPARVPARNDAEPYAVLHMADFSIEAGGTKEVAIQLESNVDNITAFELYMDLPEGLSIALDEDEYDVWMAPDLLPRRDDHTVMASLWSDGSIKLMTYSGTTKAFKTGEGDVIYMTLRADESFAGDHQLTIKNVTITDVDEHEYLPEDFTCTVTGPAIEESVTLAEVLEGTDGENYRLSEDLTVVTLVGNHAYATAADNWVRLDVSDAEGLQAGSVLSNVKGTLSGAGQSPALAVETFEAQSDVVDVTGLVQQVDLSSAFEMPAPAQVVEFLGYYFDGKLRGWSNNSGQSLELATDYAAPAFEQGKRYKVLVGIELIEPWRQPAPRRIAAQGYDYDFQNLRGQVVNASEVVITDIDTLRMGEQENTYRFNVLGQPVDEDYRGIVIENGTKRLKR